MLALRIQKAATQSSIATRSVVSLRNKYYPRHYNSTHSQALPHRLYTTTSMLHSAKESAKKIFAPTSNSDDPGHATQYTKGALDREDLLSSPTDQFHKWFQEAQANNVYQPETV